MKPILPTLELQYRREGALPTVEAQLDELFRFATVIRDYSPLLAHWFLPGKSKEDALRYEAFNEGGINAPALAVLQASKTEQDLRSISLWNGADGRGEDAALMSRCNVLGRPDSFSFSLKLEPKVNDWKIAAKWIEAAVGIWPALFATFAPLWHKEHRVFKDRPGVGWMLYLPRVLTVQQVPEARALVPVLDADNKQTGTIVVSVTDDAYSDDNPEHLKIAQAIEIRLVDQDLLPRYAEL